jgi:hypothetical protein
MLVTLQVGAISLPPLGWDASGVVRYWNCQLVELGRVIKDLGLLVEFLRLEFPPCSGMIYHCFMLRGIIT